MVLKGASLPRPPRADTAVIMSMRLGYSQLAVANTPLQVPSEFKRGQYALTNLLWYPEDNVMLGGEFQWGRRANFSDGFRVNDYKVQFSFKFSYDAKIAR